MPMLFDTKEKAEKEAYKFGCKGAHQMGDKWMQCNICTNITIKKEGFYTL